MCYKSGGVGPAAAAAGSAEEVGKKDKPVANIAAHNVIIICGNFYHLYLWQRTQFKEPLRRAYKKLLVFWTCVQSWDRKDKARMWLTPQVGYERKWI